MYYNVSSVHIEQFMYYARVVCQSGGFLTLCNLHM